jgi:hypothetical protein
MTLFEGEQNGRYETDHLHMVLNEHIDFTEVQEVMRSLDVRPRQLSRVTGMNYETIRNIAKKWSRSQL